MSGQRELIDGIRRDEYGIGVNLQGVAKTVVDNMVRKYQNLLSTVAEDLNSKESHFILELIQNADDNNYNPSVDPSLSFSVEDNRLVVKNNEIGFQEKNVRALCSASESSKKGEKRKGYIGEKGIGFKSIFKVTDTPEIHSNGFHFRFDRSNPENLLGYVVPHWHEPDIQLDEQTTLIIPAKSGRQFTPLTLTDVRGSLLLFLQKLRKLDVKTKDGQVTYHRQDNGSITTLITTKAGEVPISQSFLRKTFKVNMSGIHEPKRDGIMESEIVLAFPIDELGNAAPISGCDTYTFLPIRDFGFNFYIQADFVLASSREAIHEELEWNILLRDAISDAFIEAIEDFKKWPELSKTYLKYFPTKAEVHDRFFTSVVEQLIEKLKSVECIPVKGGGWKKPAEVMCISGKICDLFPSEDALRIFGADYLHCNFILPEFLKTSLNFKVLKINEISSIFSKHLDWVNSKPTDWKAQFYAYLAYGEQRKSYVKLLQNIPCIPLENGTLVIPSESSVFFPLSAGKKYGFEHELSILNIELINQATNISKETALLFSDLGVKRDNPFDLIQSHILKIHRDDKWKISKNEALIGHVRYIKDKFEQYIEQAIAKGQQKSVAISALKNGLYIGTKNNNITDKFWYFKRISELYLGKEFQPKFSIENLLENEVSLELLISPNYMNLQEVGTSKEAQDKEITEWHDFFIELGVNTSPKVIKKPSGNIACSPELNSLLHSDNPSIRSETLMALDLNWSKYQSSTTFKSGNNWNIQPTEFVNTLKSVITPTYSKVQVSLSEAYINNEDIKSVLGDSVIYVNATLHNHSFLDTCGITYKLDTVACLKRLRQLKKDKVRNLEQIRKIYRLLDSLWDKEYPQIKEAFSKEYLIRVGSGESTKWLLPQEVCWKETGNRLLDKLHPSLDKMYQDFYGFFVKKIKVPESLSINQLIAALKKIEEVTEGERPELALFIYRRLNKALESYNNSGNHSSRPDWVDDLDTYSLLLNRKGKLVNKSEHFYADDRPEISKLFDDENEIVFFNAPANQLPAVSSLLNELKIKRITEVVKIQVTDGITGTINNRLTAKLREMLISIARIINGHNHTAFNDAIKTGLFKELHNTNVIEVESLGLTVTLDKWSRETLGLSAARENEILLDVTTRSKHDYVAMEVEKILLKNRKGVSAHISRVLMADSSEDANDYLDIQQIPNLPIDEMEKLLSSISSSSEPIVQPSNQVTDWIELNNEEGDFSDWNGIIDYENTTNHNYEYNSSRSESRKIDKTNIVPDQTNSDATKNEGSDNSEKTPHLSIQPPISHLPAGINAGQEKAIDSSEQPKKNIASNFQKSKPIVRSGRLLSYAEPQKPTEEVNSDQSLDKSALTEHKKLVERAAIEFFKKTAASKWRKTEEMPLNNPGFDFSAESFDGNSELIEIKGQVGAWTEEGIALTPTELRTAAQYGESYWLCVVEFALDDLRCRLWLVQDPFGKTNQFRFDRGWQDVAEKNVENIPHPEVGFFVTIPELGKMKILEVLGKGLLVKLKVEIDEKSTTTKIYNPATMILSKD